MIEFYGNENNWEMAVIDEYCKVQTKLTKDKEDFGCLDTGRLILIGGKKAREFLAKIKEMK